MTEPLPIVHLVDDDPSVRRALARLLRAAGYTCETWETAEAFLARPPFVSPGCAIVDLELPGASGLDLQARLDDAADVLPVIFLTGHGDIGASVRAMKAGAVDFLTKPVEAEALLAAVSAALSRDREARAAREVSSDRDARLATLTPREREVLDIKLGVRTVADLVRLVIAQRD